MANLSLLLIQCEEAHRIRINVMFTRGQKLYRLIKMGFSKEEAIQIIQ